MGSEHMRDAVRTHKTCTVDKVRCKRRGQEEICKRF